MRIWRQREDGSEERFQMFLYSRERQVCLCQLQSEIRHYQGGSLSSQQQEVWPDPTKESPAHTAGRSSHLADKSKKVSVRSQEELLEVLPERGECLRLSDLWEQIPVSSWNAQPSQPHKMRLWREVQKQPEDKLYPVLSERR